MIKDPTSFGIPANQNPLTFHQVTSIIWSYQNFYIEHKPQFQEFQNTMQNYLEALIDSEKAGVKYNMSLDIQQAIKLTKTISILDPN